MYTKPFLEALSGNPLPTPPLWLMRQAGRYLPEYRETRKQTGSFLDMCYNPDKASEVTLQPIRRFGFDAAIIFSDILVIPDALGIPLDYVQGEGPKLSPITDPQAIDKLDRTTLRSHLAPVCEALKRTKAALPEETALIGFAGAPWTVATYMLEGGGSKNFAIAKGFAYSHPQAFARLLTVLEEATADYLCAQIEAGAESVQIFDSWAGVVADAQFHDWVTAPIARIVAAVKSRYPEIPVIGFPKGAGLHYPGFVKETGVDAVGLDYTLPLDWVKTELQPHVCVQGNLDPALLASDKEAALAAARNIIDSLRDGPFVFNLGHGILPHTPIENVHALVDTVRSYR